MIWIQRAACPATLQGRTSEGTHYNKREVVDALWHMQHKKCCYCEEEIPRTGHLKAVEHFRPKSVFPALKNEWRNLLLACSQCNGKKAHKFPQIPSDQTGEERPAILDPSDPEIDPEDHIDFDFSGDEWEEGFAVIMAKDGSLLGEETIRTIGLDAVFYTRKRKACYLRVIFTSYTNLVEALDGDDEKRIITQRQSFELLMASDSPFAGLARAFARFKNLEAPEVGLRIPGDG